MASRLSPSKSHKLVGLLHSEYEKDAFENRTAGPLPPAKYRTCALSTHSQLDSADFRGPANVTYMQQRSARGKSFTRPKGHVDPDTLLLGKPTVAPTTGILSELLAAKTAGIQNSGWAMLDTFEAHMCNEEKAHKKAQMHKTQANQRTFLGAQMEELRQRERQEAAAKAKERQVVQQAVLKYEVDVATKAATALRHNLRVKEDTERQVAQYRLEKDKLRRRKMEDEVEELEENQREMQAHAKKLVAKKAADQMEIELLKVDNARKIAHKVAMKKQVALEDQELMRQTLETLERQERERAQKLLEFQEMISKRGNLAGAQVVAERDARAEREDKLMLELEQRKEREDTEKRESKAAAQSKAAREVEESRAAQLRMKEAARQNEKEDNARFVYEVKQKDLQSKAIAEQAAALRRLAAVENQRLVQAQMDAKLRKDYLADIAMTSSEEQMNAPSLKQAVEIVKAPHIVRVQW